MWIKIAGSLCIIVAGSYIGFAMARQCCNRPRYLRRILSCVTMLKSYLNYMDAPLTEGLCECVKGCDGIVKEFFLEFAEQLEDYLISPEAAMSRTLEVYQEQMALSEEDREVMLLMGSRLGKVDRTEQQRHLLMIEKRLEFLAGQAEELSEKNSKMYRYMGVCTSLFLVLLLL